MKKIIVFVLIMLGMGTHSSDGAGGSVGAEFLLSEVSAATAAVAAGQAASGGSAGMQRNPASILGQPHPSFSFTHYTTFGDTAYEQLEGLYPNLAGGNLAARVFYASTYNFPAVDEFGREAGTVQNYDVLMHMAYACNLLAGLDAGLGMKTFESALAGFKRRGLALDLGTRWQSPWPVLAVGASLQNIGSMSQFDQAEEQLPFLINAGLGLTLTPETGHQLALLSDFSQPLTGEEKASVSIGLEYNWQQVAFLRGGYRFIDDLGALSIGGGIQYQGFGVDYAFQPLDDLGVNHRFTVYYQFQNMR